MEKKTVLALAVAAVGGVAFCTSALAAHDHFDRANLGNKWVVTSGNLYINNDALQGDTLSLGYDQKSSGDTTVGATLILNGTDLEYGAVASGNIAGGNNAFVKLQAQNGDGMFSNGGFYVGNNGGGSFFALDQEVPSPATVKVSFCGTVATLKIKSASGTQSYAYDYGTTFGTGGGLGTYGSISLDDYKSKPAKSCDTDKNARVIVHSDATDRSLAK